MRLFSLAIALTMSCAVSAQNRTALAQRAQGAERSGLAQLEPSQVRALDLLQALKSDDLTAIRRFFMENVSPETLKEEPIDDRLDLFLDEVRKMRGGTFVRWGTVTPTEANLIYRNDLFDRLETIGLKVAREEPHYIESRVRPAPVSVEALLPASDAELARRLHAFAQRTADYDFFSGAIIITKDGHPLLAHAYGLADRNFLIPNRLDTKIRISSINKLFTAVAIGQLVEQGKVSLEDPSASSFRACWQAIRS